MSEISEHSCIHCRTYTIDAMASRPTMPLLAHVTKVVGRKYTLISHPIQKRAYEREAGVSLRLLCDDSSIDEKGNPWLTTVDMPKDEIYILTLQGAYLIKNLVVASSETAP